MAEDLKKLEEEDIQTILSEDQNDMEDHGDEKESIVEDILKNESGDNTENQDGKGTSGDKGREKGKGDWRAMLPTELRDDVDLEKYPTFTDYIKALKENSSNKPAPETDEAWSNLSSELKVEEDGGEVVGRSTFKALREAGLSTEQARKVYSSMREELNSFADSKIKETRKALLDYEFSITGNDNEKRNLFKQTLKKGKLVVAKNNPELYAMAMKDGVFLHPSVANILHMIGLNDNEPFSPSDKTGNKEEEEVSADNPFGLK